MGIAQVCKTCGWDQLHRAFALLQAQDIRCLIAEQLQNNRLTQADRINIPSGKGEGHPRSSVQILF
jgi:hypothetical protein